MNLEIKDGKIYDVLVEPRFHYTGSFGDIKKDFAGLTVWADPGMVDVIKNTPGVTDVFDRGPTEYAVSIDPRYSLGWIKNEIIARVKCALD